MKNYGAGNGNARGQRQKMQRLINPLIQIACRIQKCGMEQGVERENAEDERYRLGEFHEHANPAQS
jgi:hypothetical protein